MREDDPRFQLAVAGRILAREGCRSDVGGQISVRADGDAGFHAVGFDHFDRVDPAEVALIGWDLEVLAGSIRLPAALGTHALLYRRRPDVHAIVHLHSHHVAVLSTTRSTVGMFHVASVLFADQQVVHVDDGSAPHSAVVDTLGDRRVAIMANHGALLASDCLEHAVVEAVALEACARVHLDAVAAGGVEIPRAEVEAGVRNFRPHYLSHMWQANYERTRDECPELFALVDPSHG